MVLGLLEQTLVRRYHQRNHVSASREHYGLPNAVLCGGPIQQLRGAELRDRSRNLRYVVPLMVPTNQCCLRFYKQHWFVENNKRTTSVRYRPLNQTHGPPSGLA